MDKIMGIIRNPGFGCRDFPGTVGLWFDVYTTESTASLQCFFGDQAIDIIKAYGVYDIKDLNGKACWMREDGMRAIWVGPCKIG